MKYTNNELSVISEIATDGMRVIDSDFNVLRVNKQFCKISGVSEKGNLARKCYEVSPGPDCHRPTCILKQILGGASRFEKEIKKVRSDNKVVPCILTALPLKDASGNIIGIVENFRDISGRKKAEEKIRGSEERYRSLFENSLDGIYRTTLGGKYIYANPALVKMLGYGSKDELLAIDIPTQLYARKEDRPSKRNRIFETQLKKRDGSIIDVGISSRVICKDGKLVYYEGIVSDITRQKIAEKKLKESYKKLHKALNDIINILASIVEARDPYTSGHQKRVASLAIAISEELGLDKDRIEAIGVAALIHDIGKINIPASILARPGKLSKIEYDMIKTHPQLGYDMISGVEFPWLIADIILQHHERNDGSGYPKGLKNKDIILEAKILAVADVVEAMASYRPYRPPLCMDKALKEIKQGRGKLYDPKVVGACAKLITKKKFDFE